MSSSTNATPLYPILGRLSHISQAPPSNQIFVVVQTDLAMPPSLLVETHVMQGRGVKPISCQDTEGETKEWMS